VPGDPKGGECLVLGDSIIWNVGIGCSDMKVECFPGIGTEQLHRVTENRGLGNPDTVAIHVGTNDLRRTGNVDYVMGDVYDLVNTSKSKFSTSTVVLSGVLRRRDIMALHWSRKQQYEWVAQMLGVTLVDPNSWADDWDFGRDGLHIN